MEFIYKSDDEQICCAIVMRGTPEGQAPILDSQGDWISLEELEKTANRFMKEKKENCFDINHKGESYSFEILESDVVEQPEGLEKYGTMIPWGAWYMTVHITDDSIWEKIRSSELTGFSPMGTGNKREA